MVTPATVKPSRAPPMAVPSGSVVATTASGSSPTTIAGSPITPGSASTAPSSTGVVIAGPPGCTASSASTTRVGTSTTGVEPSSTDWMVPVLAAALGVQGDPEPLSPSTALLLDSVGSALV